MACPNNNLSLLYHSHFNGVSTDVKTFQNDFLNKERFAKAQIEGYTGSVVPSRL